MVSVNCVAMIWNLVMAASVVALVVLRVAGDTIQQIGSLAFLGLALGWSVSPYLLLTWMHKQASLSRLASVAAIATSIAVSFTGIYFMVDAWVANFSPLSSPLTLFFLPLYQFPLCLPALVMVLIVIRARRAARSTKM